MIGALGLDRVTTLFVALGGSVLLLLEWAQGPEDDAGRPAVS